VCGRRESSGEFGNSFSRSFIRDAEPQISREAAAPEREAPRDQPQQPQPPAHRDQAPARRARGGDKDAIQEVYAATVSAIDKSVNKGVLHRNAAARYKSRLTARVNGLGAK
jgi:hypothetical protein